MLVNAANVYCFVLDCRQPDGRLMFSAFNSAPWEIFHFFCRLLIFWNFFEKFFQEYHLTDWIQIRPDVLLGLVWVQSVCKCYEQTTLVGNRLKEKSLRLKMAHISEVRLETFVVCPAYNPVSFVLSFRIFPKYYR